MATEKNQDWNALLGLNWQEAQRRLQDAGAVVLVSRLHGKRGPVEFADCERVIRIKPDGEKINVVISSFKNNPNESLL